MPEVLLVVLSDEGCWCAHHTVKAQSRDFILFHIFHFSSLQMQMSFAPLVTNQLSDCDFFTRNYTLFQHIFSPTVI